MKTSHIYENISLNLSYNEKCLDKSSGENHNTHFTFENSFRKSCRLRDNVEKCCAAKQATNGVTIWRIQVTCWISKATYTHAHAHAQALGDKLARTHPHTHTTRHNVSLYVHRLSCLVSTSVQVKCLFVQHIMHGSYNIRVRLWTVTSLQKT